MREFVYLSDAKLRQFVPEPRRFGRQGAIKVATPLGGVDLEPSQDPERSRLQHLQQVMRRIDLEAEWFTEPDLRPGRWIQFEAPLNLVPLNGPFRNMTLSTDRGSRHSRSCIQVESAPVRTAQCSSPAALNSPYTTSGT
jgi:hypothetical protein